MSLFCSRSLCRSLSLSLSRSTLMAEAPDLFQLLPQLNTHSAFDFSYAGYDRTPFPLSLRRSRFGLDDHLSLSLLCHSRSSRPDTLLEPFGCLGLGRRSVYLRDYDLVVDDDDDDDLVEDADGEVVLPHWTSIVGRRSSPFASMEFSRARAVDSGGLRAVGFDSDSDSDEQIVLMGNEDIVAEMGMDSDDGEEQYTISDDLDLPLCWDGLRLGDGRRDAHDGLEWEEIDGRDEEGDVLGNYRGSNEDRGLGGDEVEPEEVIRNVDWEVLLAMNNLGRSPYDPEEVEAYFEDQDGLVYASDYEPFEFLFGQFAEQDSNTKGSPPAAKSVVENLPSVVLAKEDATESDVVCAVCKDGIQAEEIVKRLPCLHHYHECCILPWLGMRNTCPLCRFELPTDDPQYEKQKARRANSVVSHG